MSFWAELGRRNVYKVGAAYAIVAWLVAQIASVFAPALSLPEWVTPFVVFLLILGFPIALLLAWAYELTPDGIKRTRQVPLENSIRHVTGQKLNYVVTGLLVVAVGFIAADYYLLRDTAASTESAPASTAPVAESASASSASEERNNRRLIAVLPLDNLSPDPEDAFFAAGLHEEIVSRLAKLESLQVISRTSVMRYSEDRPPIRQIAAELDADAILEGSVRYAGDRILVTAQLIDAATDTHLWTDSYPGDLGNLEEIFAIQADIAISVANALEAELSPEERTRLARMPTDSREAYELYLAALDRRGLNEYPRAIGQLERAVEIDPDFAEAWSEKARLQISQAFAPPDAATELRASARRDAARAVALDADSAVVRANNAFVLSQQGEWIGAEREYQAMLALGGDRGDGLYVLQKLSVGDFAGAKQSALSMREKDPLNPAGVSFLAWSHGLLGETAQEMSLYAQGDELFGKGTWLNAQMYFRLGRRDLEGARAVAGPDQTGFISYSDSPDAGLAELRRLIGDELPRINVAAVNLAARAAFFGDDELALTLLTTAFAETRTNTYWIWLPLFERMRQRPAFKTLVRDLRLVDYWREYGWPEICQPTQGDDFACR
jgi:TolB-like protein